MTVIVLYKDADTGEYKITGDGRTSQDWIGVFSDNTTKVFNKKDFIFGSCGDASSKTVIPELLKKAKCNGIKLLKLANDSEFKDIMPNCQSIYAHNKEGLGLLASHKAVLFGSDKFTVMPLEDEQLPQCIGSGFISVRTLLAGKVTTQATVEKAIKDAYEVNHTIGGKITTVTLAIKKNRTTRKKVTTAKKKQTKRGKK